jgi:hypothetical protein
LQRFIQNHNTKYATRNDGEHDERPQVKELKRFPKQEWVYVPAWVAPRRSGARVVALNAYDEKHSEYAKAKN